MQSFTYLAPRTLSEALTLLGEHAGRVKPLAGGTDLMVELRDGDKKLANMDFALDLTNLPELREISQSGGRVTIGAMATHNAVAHSPVVLLAAAMLAEASASVGAQQIRNAATIGGNVCNAAVAADTLSPLAALDASVTLLSVSGARELPLGEFIAAPGKTVLRPDELLTSISFSALDGWQTAFVKLGRRKALAISRMNAAAALRFENGRIADARISPGCVFPTPRRVPSAEELLLNQIPSLELFTRCGEAVSEAMVAVTGVRWSTEYKVPALSAIVRRALCRAAGLTEADA